jgi:acetolactate synthase-1/2/3 large subunit
VGCRFSEFSTHGFSLPTPDTALIHIDSDPEEIGRIFPPQLGIMSDAAQAVNKILQCLEDEPLSGSCRQIDRAAVEEALDRFKVETRLPSGTDGEGEIFSGNAVQAFQQGIPDNAWLVLDTATFGPWMTRYYGFQRPGTLIAPAGGCLGFGFGAALGAQLACPDRSVVCLVGDGGFAMVAQDIETAVRCNIPVTVVVCNNFAFGNIRSRQKTEYEGREIGGLYGKTDYAALARVYGAVGMTARTADELLASLQKALSGNRPTIIDMILGIESGMPPGAFPPRCRG